MTIQEKRLILLIVVLPCAYFLVASSIGISQFRKLKNCQIELKSTIILKLFILTSCDRLIPKQLYKNTVNQTALTPAMIAKSGGMTIRNKFIFS